MNDPDPTDAYAATGAGAELFDAPAVFYLTHAEAIERWHRLRRAAVDATSAFLDTIIEEFEAPERATPWRSSVADARGGYRRLLLAPESCPIAADGTPAIAVCFGWQGQEVSINPGRTAPSVGVRIGGDKPKKSVWREEFLRGRGAQAESTRARRGYLASGGWPAWRYVTAPGQWWQSLDTYRSDALQAIDGCLSDFADDVEWTVQACHRE